LQIGSEEREKNTEKGTIKYKGLEMANEGEKIGETDRTLCGPL